MKRLTGLILLVPLFTACSATMENKTTTLEPLPTTAVAETVLVTSPLDTPEKKAEFSFVDDVYFYYGAVPTMSDEILVETGRLWCQLMTDGMSDVDVVGRINEGSSDNDDARLHFSIVNAGIENLCPSQWNKAEYIALNSFLP